MKKTILFCALFMLFVGSMNFAQTYYVDPAGTNDGSHGSGLGANAWATINFAISQVSSGATINVAAGTYVENVVVNKAISLMGAGANVTSIVATTANNTPLVISTSNSLVDGFTITHDYTPAELSAWNFNNNGVTFNPSTSGNTISNCVVTLNRNGIYLNTCQNNIITDNAVINNRTGINMTGTIDGTVITNNTISDNWTIGIVTYYISNTTNYSTITITGNTFDNNWYSEILIKDASANSGTLDVSSNTFTDSPVTYSTSSNTSFNEEKVSLL